MSIISPLPRADIARAQAAVDASTERPAYERMVTLTAEQIAALSPVTQESLMKARAVHGDAAVDLYLSTCATAGVADANSSCLTGEASRSEWDRARALASSGREMGIKLGITPATATP